MIEYGQDYTCRHGETFGDCSKCPPPDEDRWTGVIPDPPEPSSLFVDVAALLAGGLPETPPPVLLTRDDGHRLLYAGKVNVLFGDPECGKTWIALAAIVEALHAGRRSVFVDLDHNGANEILSRLLALGAHPKQLGNADLFKFTEPDDEDHLIGVIQALRAWAPAVAVVDSLGELLPLLRLSSNSPDDYTAAHRRALTPLSNIGTCVVVIDHLPKSDEARTHGQTGTLAKRRAVNGVSLRVTLAEPFAPGRGGSANMVIHKDRPGGVRAHSPVDGKNQPAGRFVMSPGLGGTLTWHITTPSVSGSSAPDADVAELDSLAPPPRSQRDVQERLGWGSNRAMAALRRWRELGKSARNIDDDAA